MRDVETLGLPIAVVSFDKAGMWDLLGLVEAERAGRKVAEQWWELKTQSGMPPGPDDSIALCSNAGPLPDLRAQLAEFDGEAWRRPSLSS